MHLSQSFQINSKPRRAEALKPAANGGLLHAHIIQYPTIYIYRTEVHLPFCNCTNENFELLKKQVNGPLPNRGEQTGVPGENPRQPARKSIAHINNNIN